MTAENSVFQYSNANDMRVTQDLNSFGEIIAHAQCSVRQSTDQNFSSRGHDRQSSEQNNRKLISLHNNGENDKHAHGFADFKLLGTY